jgi:HlyD family secretion protein
VLCSVSNEDLKLLPNTNVNVQIRTAERENSLTVPRSVVRTEANDRYVFVVEAEKLQRRPIKVGVSNATTYEVLSGITENDRIAMPGNVQLESGLPVVNIDRGQ